MVNTAARAIHMMGIEGEGYRLYNASCLEMPECPDDSIALTVTSPPYWNSIDYDIHVKEGRDAWHREREYEEFGKTFNDWVGNIGRAFEEVLRVTMPGGFCAVVVGTILHKSKHYPAPMMVTGEMMRGGWEFHQDIIWNKVTGGVKRAGTFIQHQKPGYYYPNIMTEYILVFRKPGEKWRGSKPTLAINELFTRDIANNVWHIAPVPPRTIEHPCPYPEELVRRLVLLYSQEGDEVLDPFIGSGQTAIAALRERRRCVGYDIEHRYLELSQKRIDQEARGENTRPKRRYHILPRWEKVEAAAL